MGRRRNRVIQRFLVYHMNYLDKSDAGQLVTEASIDGKRQMITKLKRVCAATPLLRDDSLW